MNSSEPNDPSVLDTLLNLYQTKALISQDMEMVHVFIKKKMKSLFSGMGYMKQKLLLKAVWQSA